MNKECVINFKYIIVVFLLLPIAIAGCSSGSAPDTDSGTSDSNDEAYTGYLIQVKNDEQIEALLKSSIQQSDMPEEFVRIDAPSLEETDSISKDAYSDTTLIEHGVDEMDLVKFDGDIIYQSHQSDTGKNEVRLLKVDEGEAGSSLVSTIKTSPTDNSSILGLYLYQKDNNKTMVVLSQQYQYGSPECGIKEDDCAIALRRPVYWTRSYYTIEYYDVTVAESPVFIRSKRFKGAFLQSRRISNRLYTISNLNIGIRGFHYGANSKAEIDANNTLLENIKFQDLVPKIKDQNGLETNWFSSQNCYVPEGLNSSAYQLQLTVITSSDLDTSNVQASCFLGYSQEFYASTNALYFSEGFDWQSKNTRIHQFDFSTLGVEYAGSGTVIGRIGGKFKMNEKEGYLRVVSSNQNFNVVDTISDDASDFDDRNSFFEEVLGAEHYLSILKKVDNERELKLVSRIPNQIDDTRIGKDGESIFGVRFINDRAYIVTFLRTDPFYIVDVSNPFKPSVTGELEIPGFSTQLFPVNENYILGVGQENGLKLDLYDVSDITNPVQSSQYLFGANYYSPALYDHHSISMLYDQATDSMKVTLPAQSNGISPDKLNAGLYLFDVDALAGEINLNGALFTRNNDQLTTNWEGVYDTRAIIAGDNVHYVTPQPVYSAPWADPGDVSVTP